MGGRPKVSVSLTDDELIALYDSKRPLHMLCTEHNIEDYALNSAWTKLKAAGKIKQGRRLVVRTDYALADRAPVSDNDGRPHVGYTDKLLARLIEVHKTPRYDIAKPEDVMPMLLT